MKPTILITGASGSLAQLFTHQYSEQYSFKYLTRNPKKSSEYKWDIEKREIDLEALKDVNILIHLAGANIAGARWTKNRKKELCDSRIESAKLIAEEAAKHNLRFDKVISASAVGYYGSHTSDRIYSEADAPAKDFLGELCKEWEDSAALFKTNELTDNVVCLRFGVILSKDSGVIERIKVPNQLGLGAPLGSGKQYVPWIHEIDVCRMLEYVISSDSLNGSFNAVAPEHITNKELTKAVAKALDKPYFLPNVPSFMLKLVFGEMSTVVLEGSRVSSEKIAKSGFTYTFPELENALSHILEK